MQGGQRTPQKSSRTTLPRSAASFTGSPLMAKSPPISGAGWPGLTPAEVAERVARGQVNRVRRADWLDYLDIGRRNVLTLFNALVVPAAVALFLLSDRASLEDDNFKAALAVSGMALTNLLLGL